MRIFLCFIPLFALGQNSAPNPRVDQVFAEWAKPDSPGCSLAVMNGGRIVYKHGYGMADLDHDLPIMPSSVFHVASISKQFTAASILLLAEDGKLSIDDPIRKYLPEVPDFGTPITIRHLIHHISGLRDQWSFLGLAGWRYSLDLITDEDVMSFVTRQKALNFQPGAQYMYSNTGYTLLGQIVKRVSGKSLREFTTERIFQPLGMTSTHFRDNHAEIVKGMAYGYVRVKGVWEFSIPNFDTVGATSLLTTAEDLAKWDENFYQEWARKGLTEKMLNRGVLNDGTTIPYAFGLQVGKHRGLPTVEHGGSDAGYRAEILRFPEQHFSIACLCSVGGIDPAQLAHKVAEVYIGGLMEPVPAKAISAIVSEETQKGYIGSYWNAQELELREVRWASNKLRYSANGGSGVDLEARSDTVFRLPQGNFDIEFAKGQITEIRGGRWIVFTSAAPAVTTAAALKEFAGTYRLDEMESEWTITAAEGHLTMTKLRNPPTKIEPHIANVFSIQGRNTAGLLRFTRGKDGKVDGFVFNGGRIRNVHFTRLKQATK